MKDSEFKELLNLYLDHEITAADAARLEAEVQRDPQRRKVYEQYCRMQKACKMLASDFVGEPAVAEDNKVVRFDMAVAEAAEGRRKRMGNFYTIGSIAAAAACVAIVFLGRSRQAEAQEAQFAATHAVQSATVAPQVASTPVQAPAAKPEAVMVAAKAPTQAPAAVAKLNLVDPLFLSGSTQADALMAAAKEQAETQLAWIGKLQLPPVQQPTQLTELRFEVAPASFRPDGQVLLGNRAKVPATNPDAEMAALRFVK